jgi:2-polyprenyl-6-methoxyphenol hydroxylase-like FAD-dependent oxidoreductase
MMTFIDRLQARFGWRLGRLSAPSPRQAYPLKLKLVRETIHERLVLIGNAAHTLHPVAGQGFNLGLRDVAALAEALGEAARCGQDPGSANTLADYKRWRGRDQSDTARLTDTLARLFVAPWRPVRIARNLGLLGWICCRARASGWRDASWDSTARCRDWPVVCRWRRLMSDTRTDFDVVVVGGGMVGAAFAAAFSGHGRSIAVVESASPSAAGRLARSMRGSRP